MSVMTMGYLRKMLARVPKDAAVVIRAQASTEPQGVGGLWWEAKTEKYPNGVIYLNTGVVQK